MENKLRRAGIKYEARVADGRAAYVRALEEAWPDLILCDYTLPDIGGCEALALAKQCCPQVPVIIVTGSLGEEAAAEVVGLGAVDHVLKSALLRLGPAVRRALQERDRICRSEEDREAAVEVLVRRDRVLEAVVFAAGRLLSGSWDDEADAILACLGTAVQVTRVRILRLREVPEGTPLVSLLKEWVAPDVVSVDGAALVDLPFFDLGCADWYNRLLAREVVHGSVREFAESGRPLLESQGVVSLALAPIFVGGRPWGLLDFEDCARERPWLSTEIDALRAAADTIGSAMARERAESDLRLSERRSAEALSLLRSIQSTAPVGLAFVDGDLRYVSINERLAAIQGISVRESIGRTVAETGPHLGPSLADCCRYVLETGEELVNVESRGECAQEPGRIRFWLGNYYPVCSPRVNLGVGVVVVDVTEQKEAEQERNEWARASAASIAAATEARDPYVAGHQRRVARMVDVIANELGLDRDTVEGITLAAEIHDIGKIGVPAEILSKPGRLLPAEFELVKMHPGNGRDIVAGIKFPWPVADMIHQHHEAFDGSGYPLGLKGEELLLGSRILHVADVLEAMSSHRPYRPARKIDETLDEIEKGKGTQFDPVVAEACLRLCREGRLDLEGWK